MSNHKKIKIADGFENNQRENIRWIQVIYDSIFYLVCWQVFLVTRPSIIYDLPFVTTLVYLLLGYALFFGFRFWLKSYKQILRYGSIAALSRELLATVPAGLLLTLISVVMTKGLRVLEIPFVSLVSFVAVYIVISIAIRVFYCYLYRFAELDTFVSRVIRKVIIFLFQVDFNSEKPGATLHFIQHTENSAWAPINELQNVVDQFVIHGTTTQIMQINKGYINRTYRVDTLSEAGHVHKYTLQRINTNVFPDVDALMENFKLTTNHLHGKFLLPGHGRKGSVQTIRYTKDGRAFLKTDSGCWRMLSHFDGVYSLDIPDRPETFYYAGNAFGMFLKGMSDVAIQDVKEVIPNFHNTKDRYKTLEASIARDPKGRVKEVLPEIAFVRERADKYGLISDALASGRIPTRICHNDCNLNNILFDNETHLPVAIIDLDTVMPSSPLYDFGDSMRIGTNTAKDDEKDLSKVSCDLALYEQYALGYLEACGDILTREELELLPYAALIITAEDGIRFLTDYIDGDTYYNIYYPGQNLDRARTQLKLLEDMEKKLPEIKKILRKIYRQLGLHANLR